jgi:hypothetical protein
MAYPPTPWKLQDYAIQTLHFVNITQVRSLIPPELKIVAVWPGKTLASVYLSQYQSGSVLEYNELIIAPALVSCQGKFGGWISHIYVDNSDSVAGGREIWGLPKELAEFTWQNNQSVSVTQDNRLLCYLNYQPAKYTLKQNLSVDNFSVLDDNLLAYKASFNSRLGLIGSQLEIPADSPFFNIGMNKPWLTLHHQSLLLTVDAPQRIKN